MRKKSLLFAVLIGILAASSGLQAEPKLPLRQEEKAELLRVDPPGNPLPFDVGPVKPPAALPPFPAATSSPGFASLRLELRELWALQRAAQQAGGTLTITIQTAGGITVDDLLVPLAQCREITVRKEGNTYVVSSTGPSADNQLELEIKRLTERRNALLQQIKFLESH